MSIATAAAPKPVTMLDFIHDSCVQELRDPHHLDTAGLAAARRILKIGTLGLSIWGSTPGIKPSQLYAGTNVARGYAYAVGNMTANSSVLTWSFHGTISHELHPCAGMMNKMEHILSRCARVSRVGACVVIGVVSQIPRAYLAYFFNNNSTGAAVLVLTTVSSMSIYSLDLTARAIMRARLNQKGVEKKLNDSRKILCEAIDNYRKMLRQENRGEIDNRFRAIKAFEGSKSEQAVGFLQKICAETKAQPTTYEKCATVVALGTGTLAGGFFATMQIIYGYKITKIATSLITNSDAKQSAAGVGVMAASLFLTAKVNFGSTFMITKKLLTNPLELIMGASVASRLAPGARTALGATLITATSLSLGPLLESINVFFTGNMQSLMTYTAPPGVILMFLLAMETLADEITALGIEYGKEQLPADIVRLDEALGVLSEAVQNCTPQVFAQMMRDVPTELRQRLTPQTGGATIDEIGHYLDERQHLLGDIEKGEPLMKSAAATEGRQPSPKSATSASATAPLPINTPVHKK